MTRLALVLVAAILGSVIGAAVAPPATVFATDPAGCVRKTPGYTIKSDRILRVAPGGSVTWTGFVFVDRNSAECGPTTYTLTLIRQGGSRFASATWYTGKTTIRIRPMPGTERQVTVIGLGSPKTPASGAGAWFGATVTDNGAGTFAHIKGSYTMTGIFKLKVAW